MKRIGKFMPAFVLAIVGGAVCASDESKCDIANIQTKLSQDGYEVGAIDGIWGAKTASGLKKYQAVAGLKVTGRIDADTCKSMGLKKIIADDSASSDWGMVPPYGCYWECVRSSGCKYDKHAISYEPKDYDEYKKQLKVGAPHPMVPAYFLDDGRGINFLIAGGKSGGVTRNTGNGWVSSGRLRIMSDPFGFHVNSGWKAKCD